MRTVILSNDTISPKAADEAAQHSETVVRSPPCLCLTAGCCSADVTKLLCTQASYPDDVPLRTLALHGDSRAALAPFLAHR